MGQNSNPFNLKYNEDYEYVQLPKHLYDLIIKEEGRDAQERLFFKEIESRKYDLKNEIENLEEDVLRFKAVGVRYKNNLEKIYNEQYEELEKMWNTMNLEENVYAKLKTVNSQMNLFKNSINEINSQIKNVNVYNLEKVIDLVEKFNRFSQDDKDIITYLMKQKDADAKSI